MEDFVSFEIAKKLKDKGFPQSPYYVNYSSYYEWDGLRKINSLCNASVWFDTNISKDNLYFAPTISQVLDWLRRENEIDIAINPIIKYDDNLNRIREYSCDIFAPQLNKPYCTSYYDSYEQASLVGIEYVLNNLI